MSNPGQGQPQKPTTPPGHEDDPGRGPADAPGQQKPRPNQDLPEPDDDTAPNQDLPES